jgi:hypothetical protein
MKRSLNGFLSAALVCAVLLGAVLLGAVLGCAGQLWAATWPESCGADTVQFNVKTEASTASVAAPEAGKAQIIFIETQNQMVTPFSHATIRFGVDGAWAGANKGNSYFVFALEPGVHHLCASWQSELDRLKKFVELTSFTAEPGQVYYFATRITAGRDALLFDFSPLNDDEGKYLVQDLKVSTWKAK